MPSRPRRPAAPRVQFTCRGWDRRGLVTMGLSYPLIEEFSMNARDAIRIALQATHGMLNSYVSDLSDADLLVRPVPNANHIAWQLGHLISAEVGLLGPVLPGLVPVPLPPGFKEQHDKATASVDPPKGFLS